MDQHEALERLQDTELKIMLDVADVCAELGITWFMDSGTALGAIRHQGFIPWDDDIDLGMMRADYNRFVTEAPALLALRGLSLHTTSNTSGFAALFAKVFRDGTHFETLETREAGLKQGIFVDVFPYDLLWVDSARRSRQISVARTAQRRSYLYHASSIAVPHKGALGAFEKAGCFVMHHIERLIHW